MAKVVKTHLSYSMLFNELRKLAGQIMSLHAVSKLIYKYIAVVIVIVTVPTDFFIDLLRFHDLLKVLPKGADQRKCKSLCILCIRFFPPLHTVRESFPSYGAPSLINLH